RAIGHQGGIAAEQRYLRFVRRQRKGDDFAWIADSLTRRALTVEPSELSVGSRSSPVGHHAARRDREVRMRWPGSDLLDNGYGIARQTQCLEVKRLGHEGAVVDEKKNAPGCIVCLREAGAQSRGGHLLTRLLIGFVIERPCVDAPLRRTREQV